MTIVPLLASLSAIPALSDPEIAQVEAWMESTIYRRRSSARRQKRMTDEIDAGICHPQSGALGLMWWERGAPGKRHGQLESV
jgi:hypothetical protein